MKLKNKLIFLTVFLFLIIISSGIAFAEDANPAIPQIETGEVSGDVDIESTHPFASKVTNAELVYEIPENVSEIKSAYAVVSTYSGSGAPDRGLTTNISLKAGDKTEVLEYANLTFVNNTANDPVVYQITDYTTKQYSDYQSLIDITDKVKGLSSGDKITISVNNTELEGYTFDGRIKVISLIFAYDDLDNDKITYWINIGQAWSKATLTTLFNTKDFNDDEYEKVTLESIALSSKDAIYTLNGAPLSDPTQTKDSMYINDVWDITDKFELGKDTNFTYDGNGSSYKGSIQLLKINHPETTASVSIASEYKNTIYAGVNNTLIITIKNGNKKLNGTVRLLVENNEIASSNLVVGANNMTTLTLTDSTLRPVTEKTVNGNDNEKVSYTLVIEDAKGNIINETTETFTVLYNGYLGKDYEYPKANQTLRKFTTTGDVIVLNTETYSAGGDTNRTDNFTVDLTNATVNKALLYVPYNWDKNPDDDFNSWNTTFNGQKIAPISSYRDQSNLGGSSAKYGYGLVVYDVSGLVSDGINTFKFNKTSGNAAVYPSKLIVLTNKDKITFKTVYILEEADLLYKYYNKNLTTGFATSFSVTDGNVTLYVFAAGAEVGEGNLIVNNENYADIWSGTSKSFDSVVMDVNSTDIDIYFESTGGTILGLHQMVVVEKNKENATLNLDAPAITFTENATITATLPDDATGKIIGHFDGKNFTADVIKGIAYVTLDNLSSGIHEVEVIYPGDDKYFKTSKTVKVTVNKKSTNMTAPEVTTTYNIDKKLVITLTDSQGNPLSGFNVEVKLDSAKNYTTDENGQVKISTGSLTPKTYTAEISFDGNGNYTESNTTAKVTVQKATPKITAKAKTFKTTTKTKKYTVTLKDNKGKAIKNTKVTLKVNGKTYTGTTNSKGQATFTVKVTKKGTYTAVITYKGDKYYKKVTKKAKLTVKAAFKAISKGSKNKAMVKKIQKALKKNGYYISYKGRHLMVDGIYHDCTQRAVKQFQKAKGLKVTGSVDYNTAKKLKLI